MAPCLSPSHSPPPAAPRPPALVRIPPQTPPRNPCRRRSLPRHDACHLHPPLLPPSGLLPSLLLAAAPAPLRAFPPPLLLLPARAALISGAPAVPILCHARFVCVCAPAPPHAQARGFISRPPCCCHRHLRRLLGATAAAARPARWAGESQWARAERQCPSSARRPIARWRGSRGTCAEQSARCGGSEGRRQDCPSPPAQPPPHRARSHHWGHTPFGNIAAS